MKKNRAKDERWIQVVNEVWKRDGECRVWKCLTDDEKQYIADNFADEYRVLSKTWDVAHIKNRHHRDKYYDPYNLLRVARYFHSLLDQFKDPVTREDITKKQRNAWFQRIKRGSHEF